MQELFLTVLDMSITASVAILIVFLCRLGLKKAPKIYSYCLWSVILFRLLCPFSIESEFSLIPKQVVGVAREISADGYEYISAGTAIGTAYEAVGDALNGGLEIFTVPVETEGEQRYVNMYHSEVWLMFFGYVVWPVGMVIMLLLSGVGIYRLKQRLATAVHYKQMVYLADHIETPFVMGFVHPKIYIPSSVKEEELEHIILHEYHHIERRDTVWKVLAYIALCIHWFNPLVWLAFFAATKDMEMSCDEAVIRELGERAKSDYSQSLLNLATGHRMISGAPLAFGEGDTKSRIKNVLNYKKPKPWLIVLEVAVVFGIVWMLMFNPFTVCREVVGADYAIARTIYERPIPPESGWNRFVEYSISADYHLYGKETEETGWEYLGKLESYDRLDKKELKSYLERRDAWVKSGKGIWGTTYQISQVTDAYRLQLEGDYFYLVCQTRKGETLLGLGWEDMAERYDAGSDDTCLFYLYELENELEKYSSNGSFFTRSINTALGLEPGSVYIDTFHTQYSDEFKGYCIVGFRGGSQNYSYDKPDRGFAVFRVYGEDASGYRLLQCHLYENATEGGNGAYFCTDTAVMNDKGIIKDKNTYDVVFCYNGEWGEGLVDAIERIVTYRDGSVKTVRYDNFPSESMILLPWEDTAGAASVATHYYDHFGNEITPP